MKTSRVLLVSTFLIASSLLLGADRKSRVPDVQKSSGQRAEERRMAEDGRDSSDSTRRFVGTENSKDYLLQPQDVLKVMVYQEEDINRQGDVTISQEYTIFLPLIGTIDMKGHTARQAEKIIRDLYNKDYLVNPQVSVTVTKYSERTYNIFGSVASPGRKTIPPERTLTILDAISLANGGTRIGDLKKVKLTRTNPDGDTDAITINVDDLMKGNASAKDMIVIQPDDSIFVPEKFL